MVMMPKKTIHTLSEELGLRRPFGDPAHETLLSIVVTADLLWKEADRLLEPFGLTDSQLNILMLLTFQSDAGELDQTTLGRMLIVNRSNVTGLVDRMEKQGLVQRVGDTADRRVKKVRLTAFGRRRLEEAAAVYGTRVRAVMDGLKNDERQSLGRMLAAIRSRLKRQS